MTDLKFDPVFLATCEKIQEELYRSGAVILEILLPLHQSVAEALPALLEKEAYELGRLLQQSRLENLK